MSYMDRRRKMAEIRLELNSLKKKLEALKEYDDYGKYEYITHLEKRQEKLFKRLDALKEIKPYNG